MIAPKNSAGCLFKRPSGLLCGKPADHEIHDQERARKAGWKYHAFKDVDFQKTHSSET